MHAMHAYMDVVVRFSIQGAQGGLDLTSSCFVVPCVHPEMVIAIVFKD